MTKKELRALKN
jgi:hypothetical protein